MREVGAIPAERVLSFLQGGDVIDVTQVARKGPDILARAIAYVLERKSYHRERLCKAILALMTYSKGEYRNIAWALIQRIPFSHLLHIMDVIEKKENTRRLRMAIAVKIASTPREEIIRAYFISPANFRRLFSYLYLPREYVNDRRITNENYLLAYRLSQMSVVEAMGHLNLTPADLVSRYGIPLHMVMQWIKGPEEAEELARVASPDDFFRHIRWFRTVLGDDRTDEIAVEKIKRVKDPFSFLGIMGHLRATKALTPRLEREMERRAERVLDEITKDVRLENVALIVDVSGSMHEAVEVTEKLYEVFSRMTKISHLIAFNQSAFKISREELKSITVGGYTCIGCAINLLVQEVIRNPTYIQAIILVSDMCENVRSPSLEEAVKLLDHIGRPPLIILHVGHRCSVHLDYPHAVIPVEDFHPRLVKEIVANIVRLTGKMAEEGERKITEVIKERRPIDEELGSIELPRRPPESLKPGYLERVLCSIKA